jgi:hypothetical protein
MIHGMQVLPHPTHRRTQGEWLGSSALQVNREAGKAAVVAKDLLGMLAHLNVHEDF